MTRIYVAGKLSAYGLDYLNNCHTMIQEAKKLRDVGFSVYVPCLDLLEVLVAGDMNYKDVFDNSLEWLKVSDAVFLCPNWTTSKGTKREIKEAKQRNIPVFSKLEDLVRWNLIREHK